ncbi:MAG: DUF4091 domain-containing protein, partial [Myxococcales bacterium]|nr:DUF4091 domain-containing protein [Myxococcales bacterium]
FEEVYGGLFDGTMPGPRLAGARMNTLQTVGLNSEDISAMRSMFADNGWNQTVLYDQVCDNPPVGCQWAEIPTLASVPRGAGVPALVTADIASASSNEVADDVTIFAPVFQDMLPRLGTTQRGEYDDWLSGSGNDLWWYQSCHSHGCGGICHTSEGAHFTGWPSYVIDASAMQARAMEWFTFQQDIHGELYHNTTAHLASAFEDSCDYSGNGDGTLFYPGTPDRIGGTTHIPLPSIRLKLIREGLEDYEYLRMLSELGEPDTALLAVQTLFQAPWRVTDASPETLYEVRESLGRRIEELADHSD